MTTVLSKLPSTLQALEFRRLGRTLLHSLLVGVAVGVAACVFFYGLEHVEHLLLRSLAGFQRLRPAGEPAIHEGGGRAFRPWLLIVIPALGALVSGLASHLLAPETAGGGGNAFIDAFHRKDGLVRRRVAPVKALASILTLGSGGSGGREGPTMQVGAAIGSLVARLLRTTVRERRILLVAGTAGGLAAIFRTPLGAALLAVEVLYRDDFETDALVPAILSSVTAYSIFITAFGEGHLFAHAARYPFVPAHLLLYALLALVLSVAAVGFVAALRASHRLFASSRLPRWLQPAVGGLLLGALAVAWILAVNPRLGLAGQGLGILGSGYGAAQGAILGAPWLPRGWGAVELLAALVVVKVVATSLTIGSGGSAGDFGPSLVIGGLLGGAFGRAAQLLVNDPRLDPGAFALVGMGTFYGGIAHAPGSSLVMVCEMAGSYDLLVPLMLAEGVAFVALRGHTLYEAQVRSRFDSPAHVHDVALDVLRGLRVGDTVPRGRPFTTFRVDAPVSEVLRAVAGSTWQDIFPVLDNNGQLVGLIAADGVRSLAHEQGLDGFVLACDVMLPPVTLAPEDDLHHALEVLLDAGQRELPVRDAGGVIVGLLDETDITRRYHESTRGAEARDTLTPAP